MPIYEYECRGCGLQQEILQKVSDEPISICPECGKEKFIKKVSAAGFRLKGTGWYETDFKDKKPADKNGGESTPGSGTSSTDAGSKDSGSKESSTSKSDAKEGKSSSASA